LKLSETCSIFAGRGPEPATISTEIHQHTALNSFGNAALHTATYLPTSAIDLPTNTFRRQRAAVAAEQKY
jgi:hypothetical protein